MPTPRTRMLITALAPRWMPGVPLAVVALTAAACNGGTSSAAASTPQVAVPHRPVARGNQVHLLRRVRGRLTAPGTGIQLLAYPNLCAGGGVSSSEQQAHPEP
jgi:hypothetical protein